MILIVKVHYKNGPFTTYVEAEAKSSCRVDDNFEYGYLWLKNGTKIKENSIQNVEYEWREEEKIQSG